MNYYSAYVYSDDEVEKQQYSTEYIQVNSSGYYGFDRTFRSATHRKRGRKDYTLVYTHSGRSLARFKGQEHYLDAGSIFIYHPGEEQYYGQVENEPIGCYWVHFSGYGIPELFRQLEIDKQNMVSSGVSEWLVSMFEMLTRKIMEKEYNYHIVLSAILLQLFHFISSKANSQSSAYHGSKNSELINFSLNYMYMNYNKKITVQELADRSGLCVSRYINIFKEMTSYTPKEYLINIRLDKACELISNTNLSIKEVAFSIGFVDQLYFSRIFKKYKKMSPTEYRLASDKARKKYDSPIF